MTDNGMIEAFKESNIIRHSQNLLLGIHVFAFSLVFKTMDPGLKIAGVTRGWESIVFALKQFRFLIEPFRNDE